MRDRMNVYLPPNLMKGISELAERKKLSRSAIVEAAVASFLSPDGADKREAAFARRLDRLSRQAQRMERQRDDLSLLFARRYGLPAEESVRAAFALMSALSADSLARLQ